MKSKKIKIFFKMALFVVLFLFSVSFISGYFSSRVKMYVKQKAQLEASNLISTTIKTEVLPNIDLENMVKFIIGENNKVESIFVNTYQVNQIAAEISENIGDLLRNFDSQDLKNLSLPLGIILSDTLFSNLGPPINIKIYPIGSIMVDIVSGCEHYGINNSLFTISISVRVIFVTIIPLQRDEVEVAMHIPLIVQIIQGEVPRYYYSNKNNDYIPYPIID